MNKYVKPQIEFQQFDIIDIVQTSGNGLKDGGEDNGTGSGTIVIPDPVDYWGE